ncbi:response receiver CheY associated with MCPs of class 36H [Citrifermentans bemidjiense Bem]|uniref:Response receiver CheY associated with MCPs of class 36H n=1 Tax=Citrifermentans bemidjiense (strain ATCC BAA-1014 / DSM 16622 / JCM 12645 / Bem) TaxID=404380 RepID=B5EGJ4_CITBB|nr:response regulator [Citrifermentans bemidjiense]ACH38059.1 response receiver CheY associated with MCPs of class 36H [Citrifermentans bemidjiense Bem]
MNNRIMIVDDNEYVRASVEIICNSAQLDLAMAASGPECLKHLESGFKGIILMDIMMPGMDGWDTIREMVDRGLYDGNIVVMLTGMGEPDSKMDGLQEYVSDYMTKPFGPDQLIESLEYYLTLLNTPVDYER